MTETELDSKEAPEHIAPKPNAAPVAAESASNDLIFDTLWGRVLEAWDDEKTHSALLDYALRAEKLPDAAGRYRSLKDDPTKGALATKKLGAIVLAAESMLMAMKTPRAQKVPWQMTVSAFAVSILLLAWLAYAVTRR